MPVRRRLQLISVLVGIPILLFVLLYVSYTRSLARSAQLFLADLKSLKAGNSNFEEIQRLRDSHPGVWKEIKCNAAKDCQLEFAIENTWLHRLRLAPRTRLKGTIYTIHGTLARMGVILESKRGDFGFGAAVIESPDKNEQGPKGSAVRHRRNEEGLAEDVVIYLTPASALAVRSQAYELNLSCLVRFNGCKDSSELLPAAWSKN